MPGQRVKSPRVLGQRVLRVLLVQRLKHEQSQAKQLSASKPEAAPAHKPIWEEFEEIAANILDEEWRKLPVDGAEQHDPLHQPLLFREMPPVIPRHRQNVTGAVGQMGRLSRAKTRAGRFSPGSTS